MTSTRYYHAGSMSDGYFVWSDHTRRTRAAAVVEARRMARKHGGSAVVEYWDRDHGLRPESAEAVEGADFV